MTSPIAVLVEDDSQQAEVSLGVLQSAGFSVRLFDSIAPARRYLSARTDLIDLFVLDRRLPVNYGELATDDFGDELLNEVRSDYPDARLLVFTGNASIRHVQNTLQGGGQLPVQSGAPIDRVTVLEKDQSLEFKEQVEQFRDLLQSLEDIEIEVPGNSSQLDVVDRRAIRRLAFDYRAVSISVAPLGGGLTGASVWRCQVYRAEGHVATVVVKRVKSAGDRGGLPELLPRANTTSVTATLSGLMDGSHLNVIQIAGDSPYALMDVIAADPARAVNVVRPVWVALGSVAAQRKSLSVSELCESLIAWDVLSERLSSFGIKVPAGTLTASSHIGVRHGDLHPGNVLVDNDQPVLIDFDSTTFAAGVLDPVTMLMSTLVHPDSPIRGGSWPTVEDIDTTFGTPDFGSTHPCAPWFMAVHEWVESCRTSQREYWAVVLAYAGRQLRYPDVTSDEETVARVLAVARRASTSLIGS